MGHPELSDRQLLAEVRAAIRNKEVDRASAFFVELTERGVARAKAKVANDVA